MNAVKKGKWAIIALFFVNGFITGSWAVQIPQLVTRFGINDKDIGRLILMVGLGALLMMPISGILMAKFGSQRIVRFFAIISSIALIPIGLVNNIVILIITLFFLGAMLGSMNVSMNSNAVVVEKSLSKAVLSSAHCFWSVGVFVAGSMGGYIVKHFGFLTHIFLMSIIAITLTTITYSFILKDDHQKSKEVKQSIRLPHTPTIYIIGIIALFGMISECSVVDWSSRYLLKDLKSKIEIASLAFAFFSASMAIFRLAGDELRNRFGTVNIIRISSLIAAVGIFMAALASNPWQAITAFTFAGAGIANIVPIAFSAAGNQPNILTSTGMSIATTIGYIGTLMAPAPIGIIAQYTGFSNVYIGMALMLGIIFFLAPVVKMAEVT